MSRGAGKKARVLEHMTDGAVVYHLAAARRYVLMREHLLRQAAKEKEQMKAQAALEFATKGEAALRGEVARRGLEPVADGAWATYELAKRGLADGVLSAEEYEAAIRDLCERLEL